MSDSQQTPTIEFGTEKKSSFCRPGDRVHDAIASLAGSFSTQGDNRFFHDCVKRLAKTYQCRYAFIGLFSDANKTEISTIATWSDTDWGDNFSYQLKETPCADVLEHEQVFASCGVAEAYPSCQFVKELALQSYFACGLVSESGEKLGLLVVADTKPMEKDSWLHPVLGLYADRIAGELVNEKAQRDLTLTASVFDGSVQAIMLTNIDNTIIKVNEAFAAVTGWQDDEIISEPLSLLDSGRHDEEFFSDIFNHLEMYGEWQGEIWSQRKGGEIFPEYRSIVAVRDDSDQLTHYVHMFTDISGEKFAAERIQRLAHYDPITDLPNRVLFQERLSMTLEQMHRTGKYMALLLLDLDGFKAVNDSYGHAAGDSLIRTIASRLSERLRKVDIVARIGGDEFAVVISCLDKVEDAQDLTKKLLDIVIEPCDINGNEHLVSASVGISVYPNDGEDVQTLMKCADVAMYRAKEQGNNSYAFFEVEMNQRIAQRLMLTGQLRHALTEDQFLLYYQPQYDVKTGLVTGVEALARWLTSEQGIVEPDRFIPVAEESGLIMPLGNWVIKEACKQAKNWQDRNIDFGVISVNISGHQFHDENLVSVVSEALTQSQLDAKYLALEVTESWVMAGQYQTLAQLEELRELGVKLIVDDFGIAHSSMSYLQRFPISCLKIDRSFINNIPSSSDDSAISAAIIAMGHSLGLSVIASGVETDEQLDFLKSTGCNHVQGFYFAEPMPAGQMVRHIALQET